MKKTTEILLDMLYPKKCPLCHQILKEKNSLVCPDCFQKAMPMKEPLCMKCGRPVRMEEEYCQDCRSGVHHFTEGRSIFPYGEIWRQSLVRFKYYGCREYGDFYAKAISIYGRQYLERWKPQMVVPVPLHSRKKRMRGFNQAAYLAKRVSCFTGIPWSDNLVTRKITGFSVLVVDDVYTTGSTMDAMAMCLQEAGAKDVYFLTVCAGKA